MSQVSHRVNPSIPKQRRIPPLQNGDRLTLAKFEERYDATPGLKHAELIDGKVFMSPPMSYGGRSRPHANLITVLGVYRALTPGVDVGDNGSVRFDIGNMPQPDAFLLINPSHGGQTKISADDYITGAPELIVEVSATSASFDLHDKFDLHLRNSVREYIVWRTLDEEFDYFILRQGKFERLTKSPDNLFHSEVFPGLWLDPAALIAGDLAFALQRVQQGIASPEHQTFVATLQQRANSASIQNNPNP